MNEFSQKLKKTYQNISSLAFELLEVTEEPIRQVHEDAISSIFLKKVAKLKDKGFFTKTKSLQINEPKTGIDFDLWIGENDSKYLRFTIQAKSFGNRTSTNQKYSIDGEQCQKIINHSGSGKHKSFPLYFLYQYIIDDTLQKKHFSFLDDFEHEYSSITFSSAYNVQKLIKADTLKFSDIHENNLKGRWKNDIYSLFEEKDEKISLPLYLLHDISPSKIEKFQKLISTKHNSAGFFFFFFFGEEHPFEIHEISANQIEELYGQNSEDSELQFKNLVIINDENKLMRDREISLKKLFDK